MRAAIAVGLITVIAGCDSAAPADCKYDCTNGAVCPAGLTCVSGMCRQPALASEACSGDTPDMAIGPDAAPDSMIDAVDAENTCTWAMVATNFTETDLNDPNPAPWEITSDETFTTGGVRGHAISQIDGEDIWIVQVTRFAVAVDVTLTIEGTHPLIIAADEIEIAGTIVVLTGANPTTCDAQEGQVSCAAGAGGGGGGYGGVGGNGGGPLGTGGAIDGVLSSPLRGGCDGAKGGDGQNGTGDPIKQLGGGGGSGAGALQLSARATLTISGTIEANGFGGGPGRSDHAGGFACPGLLGRAAGGGGGGGGGTILLEGCATTVAATGKLCANGGGGGGGSGGGGTDIGVIGQAGRCDAAAGGGLGETGASHAGGVGGFDGTAAGDGAITDRGGGGGGGAVGRIHIRQVAGAPMLTGATIRPPANRTQ